LANPFLDDLVEPDKCAATNEKNLFGVDLNVFLVRMLASALRRDITTCCLPEFSATPAAHLRRRHRV
jgi:hypothetical protein